MADEVDNYWERWSVSPAETMPFKGASWIRAILPIVSKDNGEIKTVLIVCFGGEIISFKPGCHEYQWRCNVYRTLHHAAYDYVTGDIYFVPYGESLVIFRINGRQLEEAAAANAKVQLVKLMETPSHCNSISIDAEHRLLFTCEPMANKVNIWRIISAWPSEVKLIATISCVKYPQFVALHFDDEFAKIAIQSSRDDVILLSAKLSAFTENALPPLSKIGSWKSRRIDEIFVTKDVIATKNDDPVSVDSPLEIAFDNFGNLFVVDNGNKRFQIYKKNAKKAVWASSTSADGNKAYRLALISKHPKTGKPAAIISKDQIIEWHY